VPIIAGAVDLPGDQLVKLITADLFTCGIASIIQAVGFWKRGGTVTAAAGRDLRRRVADHRDRAGSRWRRGRDHDHPRLPAKVAAIVASIPKPVLGGAALTLFATLAVVGIQTLGKVDFTDHRT
jgi:xanthine/uracil permease